MDQVFLIFLMPVLSAYVFLVVFVPTRFYILRLSGQHLLIQLLLVGVGLFMILTPIEDYAFPKLNSILLYEGDCFVRGFISKLYRAISDLYSFLCELSYKTLSGLHINDTKDKTPAPDLKKYSSFIILSIFLPFMYSMVLRLLEFLFPKKYNFRKKYDIKNAEFFGGMASILSKLYYEEKPALITLKSKKVYIGYLTGDLPRCLVPESSGTGLF